MNDHFAVVARVIDRYKVVINKGKQHNVKSNMRFLLYRIGDDDIVDPVTNESLGRLETIVGIGRAKHVQEKLTTLESDTYSRSTYIKKPYTNPGFLSTSHMFYPNIIKEEIIEEPGDLLAFDSPEVGDLVKII